MGTSLVSSKIRRKGSVPRDHVVPVGPGEDFKNRLHGAGVGTWTSWPALVIDWWEAAAAWIETVVAAVDRR